MEASSAERVLERFADDQVYFMRLTIDDLSDMWPYVAPLLERACLHSGGRYEPMHIVERVASGEFGLLYGTKGYEPRVLAVVAEDVRPTGLRMLEIVLLGGSPAEDNKPVLRNCMTQLKSWCRENGFDRIVMATRDGFARMFPEFKATARVLEFEIRADNFTGEAPQ
jgi:hypothetical protein